VCRRYRDITISMMLVVVVVPLAYGGVAELTLHTFLDNLFNLSVDSNLLILTLIILNKEIFPLFFFHITVLVLFLLNQIFLSFTISVKIGIKVSNIRYMFYIYYNKCFL
jgi:CBS domain containing-hemolysin-like protein